MFAISGEEKKQSIFISKKVLISPSASVGGLEKVIGIDISN